MEEKIVPLKVKLQYMAGLRFDSVRYTLKGVYVARGYYVLFGFYWFCFAFLWKWPLEIADRFDTGFTFSYKPNPGAREGDLMWLKNKKWLRFDYRGDFFHAA